MRLIKRGRVWYCYIYEDGVRVQKSTQCHDRQAAEIAARRLEREAADPEHAATDKATLADALQLLIDAREEQAAVGRRSYATAKMYRAKAGHFVRVLDANHFPLKRLHGGHVDGYITQRRAEGASENTIHKEIVTLRASLKLALRRRIWNGDPAAVCPVAFAPEYKPRRRWLPKDELQLLLRELLPDRAARVAFIVATSACWSESDRVLRADVRGNVVLIRGTKRATRFREVPIVTAEQKELLRYALAHAGGQDGALFRPWGNVRHDLQAACARAGIEPCSPNDLRRTCAKWLRVAGVPIELLAPVMGHADTKMVELVYGRLETSELATLIQRSLDGAPKSAATASHLHQPHTKTDAAGMDLGDCPDSKTAKSAGFLCPGAESNCPHEDFQLGPKPSTLWPNPRRLRPALPEKMPIASTAARKRFGDGR